MWHVDNGLSIDSHDAVPNLEFSTAVCWTALNDAPNLVWHCYKPTRTAVNELEHSAQMRS